MKFIRGRRGKALLSLMILPMVLGFLLQACGNDSSKTSGPVNITYTYLNETHADQKAVENAMNQILVPKLNIHVTLIPMDYGAFDQKTRLNFASGKPCDVIWTANWMNNYYQDVINGNLLSLDDLLPKYAPKLYASMPAYLWKAPKFRGHIYAVLNQQIFATQTGFTARKDLIDKYHFDLASVKTLSDLEPFLQEIKDHQPGVVPVMNNTGDTTFMTGMIPYDTIAPGIGVRFDDKSMKLVSIYETPEYQQTVTLTHQWYKEGYLKDPDSNAFGNYDQGKYAVIMGVVVKPGGETEFAHGHPHYPVYQHAMLPPVVTTGATAGTMNAICASSQHPIESMKFLEELNSNVDLFNTLSYGVEGKDWVWKDKTNKVIGLPPNVDPTKTPYSTYGPWMFGNTFNAYYQSADQVGSWDATKKLNASATPSPLLGFNFDQTPVRTQIANLNAVMTESIAPINQGIVDPATALPKAIAALKQAGLDQVMAEVQKQLDAWSSGK